MCVEELFQLREVRKGSNNVLLLGYLERRDLNRVFKIVKVIVMMMVNKLICKVEPSSTSNNFAKRATSNYQLMITLQRLQSKSKRYLTKNMQLMMMI